MRYVFIYKKAGEEGEGIILRNQCSIDGSSVARQIQRGATSSLPRYLRNMSAISAHTASSKTIVYISVKNAAAVLRSAASLNGRIAVVDLSLVVSSFHTHLATYQALLNESKGRLKTKAIASEVLYYLSPSSDVAEAVGQYSISERSTAIAFILIDAAEGSRDVPMSVRAFQDTVEGLGVQGEEVNAEEISAPSILTPDKELRIAEYFKITALDLAESVLEECVANRLAAKDST